MEHARPESILEIGSASGGLAWAIMQIESVTGLVTVDQFIPASADKIQRQYGDRITPIYGNSMDPDIISLAGNHGDYDIVIIDGGHDWATASSDWNNYARMAKVGGMVVLHDTQGWHNVKDFDVPELWRLISNKMGVVELVSLPGVEAGTGIVRAGDPGWWDVLS
jgi:cephalosporin hydroxylase